jgi:MFS family permease
MYVLGWLAAMICIGHWVPIIRGSQASPSAAPASPRPARKWQLWPANPGQYPDFVRILRNSLLHSVGLWMAGPLFILRYVRELGASDAWLGLLTTVTAASTILGLLFWRVAAERLREPATLRMTIVTVGFFPLLAGLSPNLTLILAFAVFNGFFAAGINVSHINVLLKTLPDASRSEYMGLYATVMNAGAFVFPLIGVALAGWLGIGTMLVVCGFVALLGSLAHWIWRVPGRPRLALPAPRPDQQAV